MAILKLGYPALCVADARGAAHSFKPLESIKPVLREFDSLEELAAAYDMDAAALGATVDDYNLGVAGARPDRFGKPLREDAEPISEPPFYAVRLWPKVHHTMGGLHINERAQVMDIDGDPIPRLYAAGEIAGGVHGADRLGSCATTECLVFGRIAGENCAAEKAAEVPAALLGQAKA
mmetsp:Transcript_10910/g.33183  ORF Transcript_10910/g.33183 Transcript_10910/m.33183 type:complete len:177 (-) Transcript_10910:167-697(-)